MRSYLLFVFLSLSISPFCFGQKLNDYYVSLSIDSTTNCRLRFLNDTLVELSSLPRHKLGRFTNSYKYISRDTCIDIIPNLTIQDSISLSNFGLNYFYKPIVRLKKIKGGFIDYSKSLIYVREKDFGHDPYVTFIINGKTYIQETGETDTLGKILRYPKPNKSIQKKATEVYRGKYNIEIVKGLNAYYRFGIKRAYGVIIYTSLK